MAAKAKCPFGGAPGPDWPEIDANGRKDWDMKNCEDALREILRLFKFEGNSAEPEIQDAGSPASLIANDGVGVGARHGDAFRFTLNRERSFGNRWGHLF